MEQVTGVFEEVLMLENDDLLKLSKIIQDSNRMYKDKMTEALKSMNMSLELKIKLSKSEMAFLRESRNIQRMFNDTSLKKMLKASEQMKMLTKINNIGMSKALKEFANIIELQRSQMNFTNKDLQKLACIVQNSFHKVDGSKDISVDEITEEVVEQYITEELNSENGQIMPDTQRRQIDSGYIKSEISFWIGILGFLLTIYGIVTSKVQATNNTYNSTIEVNNTYTVDIGIDAEFMNRIGCRIINQNNVMPRMKPNCSSTVMGHLFIGQVVYISDKKKKWIEVNWKDEEGNYCFGWIQNYKVSKFK